MIEASDEEVLAYSDDSDEDDDNLPDDASEDAVSDGASVSGGARVEEDEEEEGWGPSRSDYYNADTIETEQDALDEEIEARRIQQKRLKALHEADFGFDEEAWQQAEKSNEEAAVTAAGGFADGGVVTEVLPQLQISESMGPAERLKLLKKRYPEFEHLVFELVELQPLHQALARTVAEGDQNGKSASEESSEEEEESVDRIQLQALSAYLASLAMYLALLTSAAQADPTKSFPLAPHELREHEVMQILVTSRELWTRVQNLNEATSMSSGEMDANELELEYGDSDVVDVDSTPEEPIASAKPSKKVKNDSADPAKSSQARRAARAKATEDRLAALTALTSTSTSKPRTIATTATTKPRKRTANVSDVDSDLGDEAPLALHEAEEKARRKKSLRFYTSQIAQKANKRATAGRAAGGDDDLPYRERFRDRQERLNGEAAARGRKGDDGKGAELGGDDSEGEGAGAAGVVSNRERRREEGSDDDDEYAEQLKARVRAKKAGKVAREQAYQAAKEEGGKVVYVEKGVGADGRREVGYQIEKNKGLAPRRKKEVRNPRLKKRLRYEDKKKKLASMKPTYKGGEGRGGYKGELTGIKSNLVRSTKF